MEWFYFASAIATDAISSQQFNDGVAAGIGDFFMAIYRLLTPLFAAIGFITTLAVVIRMIFRRRR